MAIDIDKFLERHLIHISEKPWSDYKESDYSLEQWHKACLIHMHDGVPTSKQQCKLPVRTPNGAVNRNGVHAAAAALAGARTELIASSEQKALAAKSLVTLYGQLDEQPPPSLLKHSIVEDFLEHFGVRGQKWGVRRNKDSKSSGSTQPHSEDSARVKELKKRPVHTLSNHELRVVNDRLNLEQQFSRMNPSKISIGRQKTEKILATVGIGVTAYNLFNSPAGKAIRNIGKKTVNKQGTLF